MTKVTKKKKQRLNGEVNHQSAPRRKHKKGLADRIFGRFARKQSPARAYHDPYQGGAGHPDPEYVEAKRAEETARRAEAAQRPESMLTKAQEAERAAKQAEREAMKGLEKRSRSNLRGEFGVR